MKTSVRQYGKQLRIIGVGGLAVVALVLVALAWRSPTPTAAVAVTTSSVAVGDSLAQVRLKMVPVDVVPSGALTDLQGLESARAARPLQSGEILTDWDVAGSDLARGLASGQVVLNLTASGADSLVPSDRVDIWGTTADCLECAPEKLATGAEISSTSVTNDGRTIVSVILEGNLAGSVLAAQHSGSLHFALRPATV